MNDMTKQLVERMNVAYWGSCGTSAELMTAALCVAADTLLRPLDYSDIDRIIAIAEHRVIKLPQDWAYAVEIAYECRRPILNEPDAPPLRERIEAVMNRHEIRCTSRKEVLTDIMAEIEKEAQHE